MEAKPEPYPTLIVPQAVYRRRLGLERLLALYPNLLVVRLVPGGVDDYMGTSENGEKVLLPNVFQHSMANLSMNLAGGLFDTNVDGHLRFLPATKAAAATWFGGDVPGDLYGHGCYTITQPCFGLCFRVAEVHRRTFPFYRHFESGQERDDYARRTENVTTLAEKQMNAHVVGVFESKKKNVPVSPRIKVHHAPTMVNYWHMTLDTYRPTDVDYVHSDERQNSADKRMFIALKQDLLQHVQINTTPDYHLDAYNYIRKEHLNRCG